MRGQYLAVGRSEELARRVRDLLARLQHPQRWRRASRPLQSQVRASLRKTKAQLKQQLAHWGIHLKGWEFRGVRRALATAPGELINAWRRRDATVERGFW